jgi:truncated hemoglobin YjbI
MSRKILIAAALVLGTAYSFACGGDDATKNTNTMPTSTATVTAPATDTATATPTATETASASATTTAEAPKPKSLFERLGGKAAIEKVTDDLLANVKDDKRINKFFTAYLKDKKKLEELRGKIIDFMCKSTGGDCEYKGKDMKESHKNMKIKDADFDAFVEDLTKALDKNSVGQTEKDELLAALGGMRGDIVTVAAKPAAAGASASAKGAGVAASAKASGGAAPKSSK